MAVEGSRGPAAAGEAGAVFMVWILGGGGQGLTLGLGLGLRFRVQDKSLVKGSTRRIVYRVLSVLLEVKVWV